MFVSNGCEYSTLLKPLDLGEADIFIHTTDLISHAERIGLSLDFIGGHHIKSFNKTTLQSIACKLPSASIKLHFKGVYSEH